MRLYRDLPAHYLALQARAEEGEDVQAELQALDDALESRAAHLVRIVRGLDAEAEAIANEERRLRERRQRLEAHSDAFRAHVRDAMIAGGVQKIQATGFTISLREGQDKVRVVDEASVPGDYVRIKREVDKRAVLDAYKRDGECISGTEVLREPSLQIK